MMEANQFGNVDVGNTARNHVTIETMVNDLHKTIRLLKFEVAFEEERTGVNDPTDPAYPILAKDLSTRLQNIEATIATLAPRLAVLRRQGQTIAARFLAQDDKR